MLTKETIRDWFIGLQESICQQLEEADGKGKFISDQWNRSGGGGGITRVIAGGNVIEKGGVNFSAVWGKTPDPVLKSMQLDSVEPPDFLPPGYRSYYIPLVQWFQSFT